jgi:hypothetical protein
MALTHYKITVGTTPVRVVTAGNADDGTFVYLANESGTTDIYLGDNTVTTSDGYLLVKQNGSTVAYRQQFNLYSGDSLWAVATSNAELQVLISGVVQS